MARYISDLETDGLLDQVTKIHCAVLKDIDTGEVRGFRPHEIDKYLDIASKAELIVGHNWISYDHEVLKKLHGWDYPASQVRDTLILGRLVYPDIKQSDFKRYERWKPYAKTDLGCSTTYPDGISHVPPRFDGNLIGAHSLKAWGQRLGNFKGDYKGGWETFSEDMFSYMLQDAEVTYDLYKKLMAQQPSEQSIVLEHRVAWLCAQMERNGFPFDVHKASELYAQLSNEREGLRRELVGLFPNWKVRLPDFVPARDNKTKGYVKGEPVERWKEHEFNPASRKHIADRLIDKYGWEPKVFTQERIKDEDGTWIQPGSPKIDDEVLNSLPYPEAKKLARYFLIEKRIGQIAEGNEAWLKVQKNGKIHARYNTNGAVTGRATHSKPNISQVPRISSPFGRECRELFHVPSGWVQIGADQSGLELRCLASDMASFDGGAYGKIVTTGDVHTANQQAAGLTTRDQAKTFIYAFLYGAGPEKIGSIANGGAGKGRQLRDAFLKKTPALNKLINAVKTAARRGWIKGIDGRKLPVRSEHAALNTRLQNSGAIICKQWIADYEDALVAQGLKYGWDGDFVFLSWSHDEAQVAVKDDPKLIEIVSKTAVDTGRMAGEPYGFNCPLDVEFKIGRNWAECH
ncbi:hypothetical protein BSL82_03500 [Tardibacter chloracetimidivorans]|uniref:DNA-directed DNA polymerase n=1 Tax=Tardibacter chloracetimidivorans TaxID=1921510 RepID=A0A1L3ZS80_9SPHN|nr:DNA polymerase [Tardibacter chloracetimidivorans]API58483.1 hypothetical protein BSL82_03500 [Tardibacter chloracetimidivorans]